MDIALHLARKGAGKVNPNPLVGAVIVNDGKIIGKGYHESYGKAHAEINAFKDAETELIEGSTMYVTLEPCSMCAGAIIQSRIRKIYYGTKDLKTGAVCSVFNLLEDYTFNHHVEYESGILKDECEQILKDFFKDLRLAKEKGKGCDK